MRSATMGRNAGAYLLLVASLLGGCASIQRHADGLGDVRVIRLPGAVTPSVALVYEKRCGVGAHQLPLCRYEFAGMASQSGWLLPAATAAAIAGAGYAVGEGLSDIHLDGGAAR